MKTPYLLAITVVAVMATPLASAQILIDDGSAPSAEKPLGSAGGAANAPAQKQVESVDREPSTSTPEYQNVKTGKGAATEYFKARNHKNGDDRNPSSVAERDRYLMIHFGTFLNDKAYRWGVASSYRNIGTGMLGVTYRVGEWKSSMDLWFRAELMSYSIEGDHPQQLSLMPIIAFPDARSTFPLYFGAGVGPGIFFNQVDKASDLALNYALIVGARFPELFGNGGLFVESGMKGLVLLFSEGQQQGVFLSAGGVFVF